MSMTTYPRWILKTADMTRPGVISGIDSCSLRLFRLAASPVDGLLVAFNYLGTR